MPSYRSRQFGTSMTANRAAGPLVRSEHERWLSDELRKNVRARYGGATVWATKAAASKTSEDFKITKLDLKALTSIWAGAENRAAKCKPSKTTPAHDHRPAMTAYVAETNGRKAKRRASSAADGERATFKVKTQHTVGILKAPGGAKGAKQVRWCTTVQEPRETVRPKMGVFCPYSTPTLRVETAEEKNRRLQNLAKFPTSAAWIDQLKVPIGKSLEYEDLPAVRPREAKPRKPMVKRYSDDIQWNRDVAIPPWEYRHAMYDQLMKMHRSLNRWIGLMAKRGAPMAQMLLMPYV